MMRTHLNKRPTLRGHDGVTLVELMMTILVFGIVMVVINNVFFTTNRLYGNTTIRAGQQMNARAAVSVMISELRTAGCDPNVIDNFTVQPITTAAQDTVHVQADYNGNGVFETAEPSETVLYYFDTGLGAVVRDPGTGAQIIINNVSACTFTYFDNANNVIASPVGGNDLNRIRSIGINVTTTTRGGGDVVTDTRVCLRNG